MKELFSRRNFIVGAAASAATVGLSSTRTSAKVYRYRQFHNQPSTSPLHRALVRMWAAVKAETNGHFIVDTFAENNGISGSDPQALKMLLAGELDFFALMGGILSNLVPAADIQSLPFVFKDLTQALSIMDGELGIFLRKEMGLKGIYAFPGGCFDNGFRQIGTSSKPIATVSDMTDLTIRVPDAPMFVDLFISLGAKPKVVNVAQLYESLKNGTVDAQENALPVMELFKLYEVQKYLSISNHMWSGFNTIANLETWNAVPAKYKAIIQRNMRRYALLQRQDQQKRSQTAAETLQRYGMIVNQVDREDFHRHLQPFYKRWKARLGSKAWSLLELQVGKIG